MTTVTETPVGVGTVRVDDMSKVFGSGGNAITAIDGMSVHVDSGDFLAVVGASGCGKSTLLSLVAGLEEPTTGTVDVGERKVAMMFQEAALFPWLTVGSNIEIPMRVNRVPKVERRRRVTELLDLVRLRGMAKKRPHELSGGMRQRVALARALAQDADVLLMDEPFGALDAMTRDILHDELERIWCERNPTIMFVTHNVREAVRLGDRVVLLSSRPGRVIEEFPVEGERPRRIDSAGISEQAARITDKLREEVSRHA